MTMTELETRTLRSVRESGRAESVCGALHRLIGTHVTASQELTGYWEPNSAGAMDIAGARHPASHDDIDLYLAVTSRISALVPQVHYRDVLRTFLATDPNWRYAWREEFRHVARDLEADGPPRGREG